MHMHRPINPWGTPVRHANCKDCGIAMTAPPDASPPPDSPCRHWMLPMERWVPVGWNRVKTNSSSTGGSAGLQSVLPTVWGQ